MRNYILCASALVFLNSCQSSLNNDAQTAAKDSATSLVTDTAKVQTVTEETAPVKTARHYLQIFHRDDIDKNIIDSNSRRFSIDEYDLNGDGVKEIFVALTGMYFCGSGGCTILLLQNDGKLITRFTVSSTPIIIANEQTHGWSDLLISSKGQYHSIKYDGTKYPSNPSIQPRIKPSGNIMEKVLDVRPGQPQWHF